MKKHTKKLLGLLMVGLLLATLGAGIVSADSEDDQTSWRDARTQVREIRSARADLRLMLMDYGFEIPDLTWTQRREVSTLITDMREDNASREEIRLAVVTLLSEYGYDLPGLSDEERTQMRSEIRNIRESYGFVFVELSEEQKTEIRALVSEMREGGANPEEIREIVKEQLISYGWVFPDLTSEQQEAMHQEIAELKRSYGYTIPDLTEEQRQNIREQKDLIRELQGELGDLVRNGSGFMKTVFRAVKNRMHGLLPWI